MTFTKQETEFIAQGDDFIVKLPFGVWKSTWRYTQPKLFMQLLEEYEGVYEIEYDKSKQKFRKIRSKL